MQEVVGEFRRPLGARAAGDGVSPPVAMASDRYPRGVSSRSCVDRRGKRAILEVNRRARSRGSCGARARPSRDPPTPDTRRSLPGPDRLPPPHRATRIPRSQAPVFCWRGIFRRGAEHHHVGFFVDYCDGRKYRRRSISQVDNFCNVKIKEPCAKCIGFFFVAFDCERSNCIVQSIIFVP